MNRDFVNYLIDNDYKPFFYKKNIDLKLDNPNRISILVWAKSIEDAYEQISNIYAGVNKEKIKEVSFDEAVQFIKTEEELAEKQIKKIQNKMNNYLHSFNYLLLNDDSIKKDFDELHKEINLLMSDDLLKLK